MKWLRELFAPKEDHALREWAKGLSSEEKEELISDLWKEIWNDFWRDVWIWWFRR